MKPAPPSQQGSKPKGPKTPSGDSESAQAERMFPLIPPSANAPYLEAVDPSVEKVEAEYPHESELDAAHVNRFVTGEEFNSSYEYADPDSESLCESCRHCWSMKKRAEVKNLDVNGKMFMAFEAYCTAIDHSLFSLNDRFVFECNLFQIGEKPRIRRREP